MCSHPIWVGTVALPQALVNPRVRSFRRLAHRVCADTPRIFSVSRPGLLSTTPLFFVGRAIITQARDARFCLMGDSKLVKEEDKPVIASVYIDNPAFIVRNEAFTFVIDAFNTIDPAIFVMIDAIYTVNGAFSSANEAIGSATDAFDSINEAIDSKSDVFYSINGAINFVNDAFCSSHETNSSVNDAFYSTTAVIIVVIEAICSVFEANSFALHVIDFNQGADDLTDILWSVLPGALIFVTTASVVERQAF